MEDRERERGDGKDLDEGADRDRDDGSQLSPLLEGEIGENHERGDQRIGLRPLSCAHDLEVNERKRGGAVAARQEPTDSETGAERSAGSTAGARRAPA